MTFIHFEVSLKTRSLEKLVMLFNDSFDIDISKTCERQTKAFLHLKGIEWEISALNQLFLTNFYLK